MIRSIKLMLDDMDSRKWRGVLAMGLVAASVWALWVPIDSGWLQNVVRTLPVLWIGLLWYVIATDSARELHFSKSAVYTTIIMATLWTLSFVAFVESPDMPLIQQQVVTNEDGSTKEASLSIAPIVIATIFSAITLLHGLIAHAIGKNRKDVKGMKKEDLFK